MGSTDIEGVVVSLNDIHSTEIIFKASVGIPRRTFISE